MSVDMRSIAKEADAGIGTLYRHFPTRERLVHAINGEDLTRLGDTQLAPDQPAIDALRQFFASPRASDIEHHVDLALRGIAHRRED